MCGFGKTHICGFEKKINFKDLAEQLVSILSFKWKY